MDEEKATRGRRGRKGRKGRAAVGRICRDCAHHDEVIHGLLRNLGRHVDSFRNYRFEGSFGIDASESDATKLDASRRRYVVAGSRWVKTTSEQLAALLVFSCNRPPGGRDELRGVGRTNGRTICFYAVIITTINSALNPCRGGYPSPQHKALQRANPHSCDVHADYSSSSLLSLADLLITFTLSCCARSTIALRFCAETLWATSAQYFLLCIKRRSRSATLWTTNLRKPLGSRCLVFLLDP